MNKTENIINSVSDAEIQVLEALWLRSPLSAKEIILKLEEKGKAHPATIKTLINRLLSKGALDFIEKNRKYNYFSTINKNDFYQIKTVNFLDRFYNGEVSPLVSFFSNQKKISHSDIEKLKLVIKGMESKNGN